MILSADERRILRQAFAEDVAPVYVGVVTQGAGLNTARIDLSGPLEIQWHNILSEAERQGTPALTRLINEALGNAGNEELRAKVEPIALAHKITLTPVGGSESPASSSARGGASPSASAGAENSGSDQHSIRTILFLASNPQNTKRLHLDQEIRDIKAGLDRAKNRDLFRLDQRWAVGSRELLRSIMEVEPNIVHFAGHGGGEEGIYLEDASGLAKLVETEALVDLFALASEFVECVVLNACATGTQARAIAKHIPYVVGTEGPIGNTAAVEFAVAFYDALGLKADFERAAKRGQVAMKLAGAPGQTKVILEKRP